MNEPEEISIYTDGSCHTKFRYGTWAAILLYDTEEIVLSGTAIDTTHNRMELNAVLQAFEYLTKNELSFKHIRIYTDSQYVAGIENRIEHFKSSGFKTKSGKDIQNVDMVKMLVKHIEHYQAEFIKVKAHQKKTSKRNINREVDKIARKLLRNEIKKRLTD